jgi:hypothetical protein
MLLFFMSALLYLTLYSSILVPAVFGTGETIYSKYTSNPPTLNGVISSTEWEDANVYLNVGDEDKFDLFFMHDDNYMYIAIRVTDASQSDSDRVAVFFDEGDDGGYGSGSRDEVLTSGQENLCIISLHGTLFDGYWLGPTYTHWYIIYHPIEIDFQAAIDYHINRLEAEFKIPFEGEEGKNDQSDLSMDTDDDVGILVNLQDYDNGFSGLYYFPLNPYPGDDPIQGEPDLWPTLIFDNEAPTITNIQKDPDQPGPEDIVTVSADVIDDASGILDVILRYSITGGASWNNVPMIGGSAYSGVIPQQAADTVVQYKVVARDNAGFVTESTVSSYSVQEEAPSPEAPGIPGFPLEAISLALIIAVAALAFVRKREHTIPASIQ